MDRSDVTQIVLEAYDSRWRGDFEAAEACFHPDLQITVIGDPNAVPFAGRYSGLDGLKTYLDRLDKRGPSVAQTLQELIVDGDCAVVRWTMPVCGEAASGSARLVFLDVLRLLGDRIVRLDQFHDTAAAASLFGASLSGALEPA